MNDRITLSIVCPVYNEEAMVKLFISEVDKVLAQTSLNYEYVFVNDGSTDNTVEILKKLCKEDSKVRLVNLSRNFGKELALTAGIDFASGDAVVPMDCDLQDPPELLIDMLEKWRSGFQVVLAKRIDRSSDSYLKRTTSNLFYKLIKSISDVHIPENVGDFRLLDRSVVEVLRTFKERSRFMKGIFASLGFKSCTVEYVRPVRAAGKTSWNYLSLFKLALEGVISFTSVPLKIWSYIGSMVSLFSFGYGFFLLIRTLFYGVDVPGYASLMVVLLFMSGLILLSLGIIGEYLARIFLEVKQRPAYIVMETIGF